MITSLFKILLYQTICNIFIIIHFFHVKAQISLHYHMIKYFSTSFIHQSLIEIFLSIYSIYVKILCIFDGLFYSIVNPFNK
jgi:hypothetical protein